MSKRKVKVDKAKLIERIQENRAQHEREYQEAREGYRARLMVLLTKMLEAAKRRDEVDHRIDLIVPETHLADYDRALALLEWEEESHLELSVPEFECYVLDAWKWKPEFSRVHANYIRPGGA